MSLYNLHYLEFLATSHDKFWSHPNLVPSWTIVRKWHTPGPPLKAGMGISGTESGTIFMVGFC